MRLPFILIIGLVLALLVFMKNPVREFQENRRAILTKYGTDELTIKTNLFLEQQQQQSSPLSFGNRQPAPPTKSSDILKDMLQSQTDVEKDDDLKINRRTGRLETNSYKARPPVTRQPVAPPDEDLYGGDNGFGGDSPAYPVQQPRPNRQLGRVPMPDPYVPDNGGSQPSPQINSYYPPVMPDTQTNLRVGNPGQKVVLSGNEAKLRSGQPIIFDGSEVYTVDAAGNKRILPDGNYTLENGSGIRVSEGRLRGQD